MSVPNNSSPDPVTDVEFKKRLVELCVKSGLRGMPRRERDRHIILKAVTLAFEKNRMYSEAEVNELLARWLQRVGRTIRRIDHVYLRRRLVDEDFFGRSNDGSVYWVGVGVKNHLPFASEVDDIDMFAIIDQAKLDLEDQKQTYLSRRDG